MSPKRFSRTKLPGEYIITQSDSSQRGSLFKLAFLWMPSCQRLPPWAVRNLRERQPPISRSESRPAPRESSSTSNVSKPRDVGINSRGGRRGAPRCPGQFMHHFAVTQNAPFIEEALLRENLHGLTTKGSPWINRRFICLPRATIHYRYIREAYPMKGDIPHRDNGEQPPALQNPCAFRVCPTRTYLSLVTVGRPPPSL